MSRYGGYTLASLLAEDAHELLGSLTALLDPELGLAED